jgi:alkylation response protein AidB-like acyl-CoA dehydrogenase
MDAIAVPQPQELDGLDDEVFRQVVRQFLRDNYPEELRNPPKRLHWDENKVWYHKLAEKGWLCPGWPKEHGGLGLSPAKQIILSEEYERHGVARTNDHGIVMLGPLVIRYGTEEQKQRFLPKILTGEHVWCQGYSEPNAGSDLAALRTEAVLDGDHYVVNGQKTWTTLATDANWIFLLVRTDKQAKKQEGISFLLVDMTRPASPCGRSSTSNCTTSSARSSSTTSACRRRTWSASPTRAGTWPRRCSASSASSSAPRASPPTPCRACACWPSAWACGTTGLPGPLRPAAAGPRGPEGALRPHVAKLKRGERSARRVHAEGDPDGAVPAHHRHDAGDRRRERGLLEPMEGNRDLNIGGLFIQARPATIYGGSNEIQRNILSKNVLGLPG